MHYPFSPSFSLHFGVPMWSARGQKENTIQSLTGDSLDEEQARMMIANESVVRDLIR